MSIASEKPACRATLFRWGKGEYNKSIFIYTKPVLIHLIFSYRYVTDTTESVVSKRQENSKESKVEDK